jgi:hypothetical protein
MLSNLGAAVPLNRGSLFLHKARPKDALEFSSSAAPFAGSTDHGLQGFFVGFVRGFFSFLRSKARLHGSDRVGGSCMVDAGSLNSSAQETAWRHNRVICCAIRIRF